MTILAKITLVTKINDKVTLFWLNKVFLPILKIHYINDRTNFIEQWNKNHKVL